MNKDLIWGLSFILFAFVFLGISLFISNSLETEIKIVNCVDGHGNVNLEGVKCMGKQSTYKGDENAGETMIMLGLIFGVLFFLSALLGSLFLGQAFIKDEYDVWNSKEGKLK